MKIQNVFFASALLMSMSAFSAELVILSCPGLAGEAGNIKISEVQLEIPEDNLMQNANVEVENGALIAVKGKNVAFGTVAMAYATETATYSSLRSSEAGTEAGSFTIASLRVDRVAKAGKKPVYSAFVFKDDASYFLQQGMKSACKVIPRRTIRN